MNATVANRQTESEWFVGWFDSVHYHQLYAHRDDEEPAGFVNQLIGRLQPPGGAQVLDLGCGSGITPGIWRQRASW
jgi:predicted TPR repeat methyltransferase